LLNIDNKGIGHARKQFIQNTEVLAHFKGGNNQGHISIGLKASAHFFGAQFLCLWVGFRPAVHPILLGNLYFSKNKLFPKGISLPSGLFNNGLVKHYDSRLHRKDDLLKKLPFEMAIGRLTTCF
jgi:hypothetical protein